MNELYAPLQARNDQGQFGDALWELEMALNEGKYKLVIALMNMAFDAGQIEVLKKKEKQT